MWRVIPIMFLASCADAGGPVPCTPDGIPEKTGNLGDSALNEVSGLVASTAADGVFFLHEDSGAGADFASVDATGKVLGRWHVTGVEARDWEDAAGAPCPLGTSGNCLYFGDIGDNGKNRGQVQFVIVREPEQAATNGTFDVAPVAVRAFTYADGPRDVEAFVIDRVTGEAWFFEKFGDSKTHRAVWRLPKDAAKATRAGEVLLPQPSDGAITGASLRPDGKVLALRTYANEWLVDVTAGISESRGSPPKPLTPIGNGAGEAELQGEAIAFSRNGDDIWTTAEAERAPLNVRRCVETP